MLKSFLKENNILQVCLSNKLTNSNIEFSDFLGYQGRKTSTLFYGIYDKTDLKRISCHESTKVIYWDSGALDIDIEIIKSYLNNKNFNKKLIFHICDSEKVCSLMNSLGIEYKYIQEYCQDNVDELSLYQQFMEKYDQYSKDNCLNIETYTEHISKQEEEFNKRTKEISNLPNDNSESKLIESNKINASKNMILSSVTLEEMQMNDNKSMDTDIKMKEDFIILNNQKIPIQIPILEKDIKNENQQIEVSHEKKEITDESMVNLDENNTSKEISNDTEENLNILSKETIEIEDYSLDEVVTDYSIDDDKSICVEKKKPKKKTNKKSDKKTKELN